MQENENEYIPYVKSSRFPHLSKAQRASQFAPFAPLEGLEEACREVEIKAEKAFEVELIDVVEYEDYD